MHEPRAQYRLITPEYAQERLNNNPNNRRMSPKHVNRYKRDILSGQFLTTHQGIAIDINGQLQDGQHRLQAIVETGISITMLVVTGLPQSSMAVIDTGVNRTVAENALFGQGLVLDNQIVSTARSMWRGSNVSSESMTASEVIAFYRRHSQAIEFAVEVLPKTRNIVSAPLRGAVARAFCHEDKHRLSEFAQVLITGMAVDNQKDSYAIVLRNYLLIGDRGRSGAYALAKITFGKSQRAIYGFCREEFGTRLYVSSDNIYPLPDDD